MCCSLILPNCHLSRGVQCPGVMQGSLQKGKSEQVRVFSRKASEPVSSAKATLEGGQPASVALLGSEVPTGLDSLLRCVLVPFGWLCRPQGPPQPCSSLPSCPPCSGELTHSEVFSWQEPRTNHKQCLVRCRVGLCLDMPLDVFEVGGA